MSIESNLLTSVQEIYFDLTDLENNLYAKGIELNGFDEFDNLQSFIDEQKMKLNYLECHMKTLFNIEDD